MSLRSTTAGAKPVPGTRIGRPSGTFFVTLVALLSALLAPTLLSGCFDDDPKGTEVENEIGIGRIYLPDGKPATFATVRIYKVDAVPAPEGQAKASSASQGVDAVLVTRTDSQGRYTTTSLPNGEYNVLAKLEDEVAYQDSLPLGKDAGPIPPDTLQDPGVVRGFVGVQPQDNPRAVTVQLIGTNRFTNVDVDGRFEFKDLGAGTYTVRLVSTEPEYTPTYTSFTAVSGKEIDLTDTLWVIFTGLSTLEGIQAVYDTARGVTTLRWKPAGFAQFQDYIIDRDIGQDAAPSGSRLAVTKDTVFRDTLWSASPNEPSGPGIRKDYRDTNTALHFTYRVRARSKTQETGPYFQSASVGAVSPYWVFTDLSLRVDGPIADAATVGDSVVLRLRFRNPTRRIKSVEWQIDPGEPAFRVRAPDSPEGVDSLLFFAGPKLSTHFYLVSVRDEAGAVMKTQVSVKIVDDKPVARILSGKTALPDTLLRNVGDTLRLKASAVDTGRVVKVEWSIGKGAPDFREGREDTVFVLAPTNLAEPLPCHLRVTDEDGHQDTAVVHFKALPWKTLASMPTPRMDLTCEVVGGKIYAIGGETRLNGIRFPARNVEVFDPATGTWAAKAPMRFAHTGHSSIVVNGEIMVAGGLDAQLTPLNVVEIYNPASDTWRHGPAMGLEKAFAGMVKQGSKIISFEGSLKDPHAHKLVATGECEAYDTVSGAWESCSVVHSLPSYRPRARFTAANIKGRTYVLGGVTEEFIHIDYTAPFEPNVGRRMATNAFLFDFASNSMAEWPHILPFSFFSRASIPYKDHILMAGGMRTDGPGTAEANDLFEAVNPETGVLRDLGRISPPRSGAAAAVVDGKLYLIGGGARYPAYEFLGITQTYQLPLDSVLAAP